MNADGKFGVIKVQPRKTRSQANSQRRVTMTDIARITGCSQATVSFVLNKAPGVKISAETRSRVIEAARNLNYAVGSLAHLEPEFQNSGSRTVREEFTAFVIDQLATSPEAVVAIDGVRQASAANGRIILVAQTINGRKNHSNAG
jgi:LacI family transcriptional regulator